MASNDKHQWGVRLSEKEHASERTLSVVIVRLCKRSASCHQLPSSRARPARPEWHADLCAEWSWYEFLFIMHLCYAPLISWIADGMDLMMKVSPQPWWDIIHRAVSQTDQNNIPAFVRRHEPLGLISYLLPNYIPSPASSFSFTTYLSTESWFKIYKASSIVFLSLFEQVHALLNVKFSLFHHLGCSIQCPCTVLYGSLNITSTRMHTY